ncbi:hypothetical protein CF319_g8912 [Tilletia indica]|uniref:Uncharacterized protein n=1 Tax=Tilletia indica TaxID=43049 RepID=A0A177TH82_9BASI|nr:hypothetical protein CF319_g8912 [Tilletia indica]KAE8234444.1 hypothetical protein CF326_g506 [Tilletia indica]KAE8245291.1 hypothetical protein A4X13_0g5996 [Tilletia indica]
MTQSTPIRIQRGGPSDAAAITLTPTKSVTASPGGRLYGTTPGGSRIVYSREQLMSLASSPLVNCPLQLRNGAQGIPAEIARRPGTSSTQASPSSNRRTVPLDPMGSPEKSSMRGMALLKSANNAALMDSQRGGAFEAAVSSRLPSGGVRALTTTTAPRRASATKRSRKVSGEERDTTVTSSDLENDNPMRASLARLGAVGGGGSKGVLAEGEKDRGEGGERRGRNRQPRVSLGSLGVAGQQTVEGGLPLPMEIDDTFGGGGGGVLLGEKEMGDAVIASAFGCEAGKSRHGRGLSSSTASSFASGPPSTRSSISTDAPFLMEL